MEVQTQTKGGIMSRFLNNMMHFVISASLNYCFHVASIALWCLSCNVRPLGGMDYISAHWLSFYDTFVFVRGDLDWWVIGAVINGTRAVDLFVESPACVHEASLTDAPSEPLTCTVHLRR